MEENQWSGAFIYSGEALGHFDGLHTTCSFEIKVLKLIVCELLKLTLNLHRPAPRLTPVAHGSGKGGSLLLTLNIIALPCLG